jgi:hypothetical protein
MGTALTPRRQGAKTAAQRALCGIEPAVYGRRSVRARVTGITMSACPACGELALSYASNLLLTSYN